MMKTKIWNDKQNKLFHFISIVIGSLIIGVSVFVYMKMFDKARISGENLVELYGNMIFCIEGILLGVILIIINFNFKNLKVCVSLCIFLGILIGSIIWKEEFKFGFILFVVLIVIVGVTMRFKNVFSTILTMAVCSFGFILFASAILKYTNIENGNLFLYLTITSFLIFYRILGVKINQFFIGKILGFPTEASTYDKEQLINQVTLIYLVLFVLLNIQTYSMNLDENIATLINNSFLTGLIITQIDWDEIIYYFRKKEKQ